MRAVFARVIHRGERHTMIAILKQSASDEAVSHIVSWIEKKGLKTDVSRGENETIIGLVGDTTKIDPFLLESMDVVERVQRVSEPFIPKYKYYNELSLRYFKG